MAKQHKKLNNSISHNPKPQQPNNTANSNPQKSKPIQKQQPTINPKVHQQTTKPTNKNANNQNTNKNNQTAPKPTANNPNSRQPQTKKLQIDERFARASYDPKFLRPKKQVTKVKIDSRFSKMLTDPAFQNFSKVDKYGRKIDLNEASRKRENQELKEYYMKDEEDNEQEEDMQDEQDNQIDDIEVEDQYHIQQQDGQQEPQQQQANPTHSIRKWMEDYNQQSSSLGDMPVEQMIEDQEKDMPEVWSDHDQNVVKNQNVKSTKRLALCNYDWMNITSKDLMILFNSFKGPAGFIKSIKVYQSNFGKQKMEQEAVFGPQGIWNDDDQADQFNEQIKKLNPSTNNDPKSSKWRKSWKELLKREQSSSLDNAKLRAYEKERLKYFYAVIECDAKKTADQIYKQCDGNQFENSNLSFDLRFIPDEISFDKNMLKEECNEMPVKGEVKNFINRAMGHSKVELTWEDPELGIAASLKKKNWGKMTQEELDKIDWATYLNEEDVEEDQNKQQLFLEKQEDDYIPDWKKECNKKYRKDSKGQKLVISFDSGFGPSKSTQKSQIQQEEEPVSLKKQKKSKKEMWMKAQSERNKRRQQLTLLTQGQDDQKEKSFKPNLQDERFKAVYSNPIFSIDPSNPKFDHRKTGNVFKEVVKRNKEKNFQ